MATFLSTAFLQQCFAMHRYDLVVKRFTDAGVVITCRPCKIRHAVRLGPWGESASEPQGQVQATGGAGLAPCTRDHLAAVSVQQVDVQRDHLELACRECRTAHPFRIMECVTRSLDTGLR